MSEERLLILKMVQDGKITPEQGEALLKALSAEAPPVPPVPPVPPAVPLPSHDSVAELRGRVADVQVKLGELQAKLGAANIPSRTTLPFGLGDFNVNQIIDEAVRGVQSIKSESVRSFKLAARAAQKEGRKISKEAKRTGRSFGIDLSLTVAVDGRPRNLMGDAERSAVEEVPLALSEGQLLKIVNHLGDIKLSSSTGTVPHLRFTRTVWSSNSDVIQRLEQVRPVATTNDAGATESFLVDCDSSDRQNITIDVEAIIPDNIVPNLETTFGNISCEGRANGTGTITTQTGDVKLVGVRGPSDSSSAIHTRSGDISIHHWDGPQLSAETVSGDIDANGLAGAGATLRTRSGDATVSNLQISQMFSAESSSGDLRLFSGSIGKTAVLKTQSGDVMLTKVTFAGAQLETVSGDLCLQEVQSGDGGAQLESVSGDIDAKILTHSALTAVTVSGAIDLTLDLPFSGTLAAATVSGEIEVKLQAGSSATVEIGTQTGVVKSALPLSDMSGTGARFLAGKLGDGVGHIRLQTVSGDASLMPIA